MRIYFALTGIQNAGTYKSQLHFTSYKADSKTEYAINELIPVTVIVSAQPTPDPAESHEDVDSIQDAAVRTQKVVRDGQVLIERNGVVYTVLGIRE